MKYQVNFLNQTLQSETKLNRFEMNAIRGGSNTGASTHIDEDILIEDPPKEEQK